MTPNLVPNQSQKIKDFVTENQQNFNDRFFECIEFFKEEDAYDILQERHGVGKYSTKKNWDKRSKELFTKKMATKK